jgi:deazaflavin-dependent oxidoreductase (nitroreductase family)
VADWTFVTVVHKALFRWSGGRIGGKLGDINIVMVDTIGRKTGMLRQIPIACYPYGDSVAVVASNNGSDKNPVWLLNLRAQPEVDIQLGKERIKTKAEELSSDQAEELWPDIILNNPRQAEYKRKSSRELPIVYFRRL